MLVKLLCGDCLNIIPTLRGIDAVVTDPPYGGNYDCDYSRFSKDGKRLGRSKFEPIRGDDRLFDPAPLLSFPRVAIFGYQHLAPRLPLGSVLIWNKKPEKALGKFLSDADICWINRGQGVYIFPHVWNGACRESERGEPTLHPTQKPIAVMEWVLQRLKIKPGMTVLDPYMGAGATGMACQRLGINFVGIEIEQRYFDTAQKRLKKRWTPSRSNSTN